MLKEIFPQSNSRKTYATFAGAVKALEKKVGCKDVRYIIAADGNGRFFPVVIGNEYCLLAQEGIAVAS